MASTIKATLSQIHCRTALMLCNTAGQLMAQGDHKEAARICLFVTTLCGSHPSPICANESKLCKASAEASLSEDYESAEEICLESRSTCPKNYEAHGL